MVASKIEIKSLRWVGTARMNFYSALAPFPHIIIIIDGLLDLIIMAAFNM